METVWEGVNEAALVFEEATGGLEVGIDEEAELDNVAFVEVELVL